jgi:SAM-dependent methyltransferase
MPDANDKLPFLYSELAEWWPLLSDPLEYAEEAQIFTEAIQKNCSFEPVTLLELGSGGGNNASHMKKHFRITLVDLSEGMLRVSQALNPECPHYPGDMRTYRLDQLFDAVFIHDAISYLTSMEDVKRAIQTAYYHCRPGGVALFVPDWTAEKFKTETSHGGHDRGERGLRYLEWSIDHDPGDHTYTNYMVYLLREGEDVRESPVDEHHCGLFTQEEWIEAIEEAGFEPRMLPFEHSELEKGSHNLFLGLK